MTLKLSAKFSSDSETKPRSERTSISVPMLFAVPALSQLLMYSLLGNTTSSIGSLNFL